MFDVLCETLLLSEEPHKHSYNVPDRPHTYGRVRPHLFIHTGRFRDLVPDDVKTDD